ncbi:NAD(+)/NADH kinase [Desulfobacterium sp. N47]|uniref:NAD(+)/NADH kinase n=1 Tax=Desulfobacterium sp. N47 TaxID=3115210 RepID=UPI003CB57C5B
MSKHSLKTIKIGLVVKKDLKAEEKANELEKWLISKKVEVIRKEYLPPNPMFSDKIKRTAPSGLFCVLVLGGDGTFLTAVRWIGDQSIPVLGIKFGEVGFLAEISEDSLFDAVEAVLENRFSTSPRMRLLVKVFRNNKEIACESVLNDVVINKGTLARLAHIQTYINDHYLTTYRADGLIIATPTGSTAYSLAAGGPVIHPSVPAIIMTPICPFTLTNRPLIIPDTSSIKIKLEKPLSNIMLTFDGQQGMKINRKDTLVIQKGLTPINMITVPGQDYFDVLKTKLRWSGGRV